MKRSYLISIGLAVAATAWIVSGQFGDSDNVEVRKPPADLSAKQELAKVRVRQQEAEPRVIAVLLRGYTEAEREVDIKAEARGRVVEVAVEKGTQVKKGDILARLAEEDRPARLAEARAVLKQRKLEYAAASKLAKKGFRAETNLAGSKAAVEAAQANVKRAEVELKNLVIKAPFDGVVDDRMMEVGDFADIGSAVARIVDLDPILAIGNASQRDVSRLAVGGQGKARLVDGEAIEGRIRFIGAVADPETRTFRIEIELPNPESEVPDGMITELLLPTEEVPAHRVSPAILSLTDEGAVGVKILDADNRVAFLPVQIIDEDPKGIWLSGLPDQITLITVGQDYVAEGQKVQAIDETTLSPVQQGALE